MISELFKILKGIDMDPNAEDVADILWLASQIDKPEPLIRKSEKEAVPAPKDADFPVSKLDTKDSGQTWQGEDEPDVEAESARADVYPSTSEIKDQAGTGMGGLPFRSPGVSALPGKLGISRSLRPLMRKSRSRTRMALDEEATVQRIAETDNWVPVLCPEPSRWLDVVLVVDESPSMAIWQETVLELKDLLETQGAFRNVQVWGFTFDKEKKNIRLHPGTGQGAFRNMPRDPQELIDPSGRRLILVISDCVSTVWHEGHITKILKVWDEKSRVAIVQMLPHWLWKRSGLKKAEPVYLRGLSAETMNSQLEIESSPLGFDEGLPEGLKVPVVALEPRSLLPWAQSVANVGGVWIPGVVFQLLLKQHYSEEDIKSRNDASFLTPEKRINLFRAAASPEAQKLAGYLAAAPLTLPIMRLVQRVMLPESRQIHLAEVFLSGLIRRLTSDDPAIHSHEVQYDFADGVRDLLIGSMFTSETVDVLSLVFHKLSCFIDKHTGMPLDFMAMIADPSITKRLLIDEDRKAFATVAYSVLRQLGGVYSQLTHHLEQRLKPLSKPQDTLINDTLDKSYYIGIAGTIPLVPGMPVPIKALCIAPFGMKLGTKHTLTDQEFVLVVGEPVKFDFLGSSVRHSDTVGILVDDWEDEIEEITTIETTLNGEPGSIIPVFLEIHLTETGILDIWCVSRGDDRRWKIEGFPVSNNS